MALITTDLLLAALGLFLPPLPVIIKRGLFSADFLINLALTCLGGLPGVCHCWYVILKYPEDGIPFIDTRRHEYRIIPDEERQSRAESSGDYPVPESRQSTPATPSTPQASSSSNQPPSYGTVPGDNKVQYP